MLKHFIGVAVTALSLNAYCLTVEKSLWTININGLDQHMVSSTSYWVYGQYHYYFNEFEFAMPDGKLFPEITIRMTYKGNQENIFETSSTMHFEAIPGITNNGIPTSNSMVSFNALGNYYDRSGLGFSTITGLTGTAQAPSINYSIRSFFFSAGKGFNPSTDPSCQTYSCMIPYTTDGKLRINFTAALTVPEPNELALAIAGLSITGMLLILRRPLQINPSSQHTLSDRALNRPTDLLPFADPVRTIVRGRFRSH